MHSLKRRTIIKKAMGSGKRGSFVVKTQICVCGLSHKNCLFLPFSHFRCKYGKKNDNNNNWQCYTCGSASPLTVDRPTILKTC